MNIPTRVGFQTPFTNITMDVTPPRTLSQEAVIIYGKPQNAVYSDFKKEMDMINRAFCEVMAEGDAKGRVFTFPIPTYNITEDFDWENESLSSLWEITAKYGIPYFSNFINSDMDPEDARSMCCRLRLDNRELKKRGGGLFGSNPLTGSIGVVTLNLPRAAYLAKNREEFLQKIGELADIAKESLEIKRKVLERFTDEGLYPYARHYLGQIKERFGAYWKNHFSTIGINGMNEACLNLLGKDIVSSEGKELAVSVLKFLREKILEYQQATDNLYNIEATPAEGAAYRLALMDKEMYPDIITSGEKKPYYTNSTHLPVGATDDLFFALKHQDELQSLYTGGTVFHGFVGERIDSPTMCRLLIKRIAESFSIPYFTITPTFSICPIHGYVKGEQFECPRCGMSCEVYSRVVGYYRPIQQWNDGKQQEFYERREFLV
jgi:ribonucleoside-triphosphate reductase